MNSRTTNPSLDYAFAPLNNWFRCSGLEATEMRGADRRSGIAFPHNRFRRHRHRRPRPAPALPQSASFTCFPNWTACAYLRMAHRAIEWRLWCHVLPRFRNDIEFMLDSLVPKYPTILLETPGTFVRARTRKGGEIRKGKGAPPVWTDGRREGEREEG